MVSAVFHTPRDAAAQARADAAAVNRLAATPSPAPARPPRQPFDWNGLWLKVFPPVLGLALLIGVWALATMNSTTFPTPWATFEEALKVFADPFYRKGPNDQGIGWNILFSLERVAVGFGLAAAVGIPMGFIIGRFEVLKPHGRPLDQPAAPGVAAGLAADLACWSSRPPIRPPSGPSSSARSGR